MHVFDANIFYPHTGTLAYSENNLGAGVLAIPVYWPTRNPYAAHNFVVLLAFRAQRDRHVLPGAIPAGDRRAAAVSAIGFAFCPFVFAHTAHIQLLMTAGLPFSHAGVSSARRSARRRHAAAALGAVMAAQALCCGYYGVFVVLMVGFAMHRRRFVAPALARSPVSGLRIAAAALVSAIAIVTPAFLPYLALQQVADSIAS